LKTDARIRFTKTVIRKNFFLLLKEYPINKISVKSICELAEINRATFYRYYSDPYDLMKQIENEFIASLQMLIKNADNKKITETVLIILEALKQKSEEYAVLISENGDPHFFNRVIEESYGYKEDDLKKLFPGIPKNQQQWLYNFNTHGFTSILLSWVQNGMQEDPIEVAEFINLINNIVLNGLINKTKK